MAGIFGLFGRDRGAESRDQRLNYSFITPKADGATRFGSVEELWSAVIGTRPSSSGISITWKQALEVTTALRCAAIIADGVCSVPFKLYRRSTDSKGRPKREEARDHALYDIISSAPNGWMTSFEMRETQMMHAAFCGDAFAFVNRVQGRVVELLPYEPGVVSVERQNDWSLRYRVTNPDGSQQVLGSDKIWHLRGRSWNGYKGLETIQLAREALGLAVALEEGQGASHKNGVRPSGMFSVDGTLDEAGFKLWRKLIDQQYAGRVNDGKAMILDRNAKFTPIQLSAADAQTIETRRFQIERICEAFGVLPIMVGAGDKSATYASSEQMFLAHLVHTVRPWHRRVEQSADRWLLTADERRAGYYFGFVDTELLRGDHKARAEYYRTRWQIGSLTGNEIRSFEEEQPIDGLDYAWAPIASAPIGEDGRPMVPPKGAVPAKADPADPDKEEDDPNDD